MVPEPAQPVAPAPTAFEPQPGGKRVAVVYTASVQGYVEPCGCTGDPLGGVARLAAVLEDARRAYGERVLFLDAGDLLFERLDDAAPADACQAGARADLLVSTYARLGLAATVLGPLDDVRGPAFRDGRLARAAVPTVGVGSVRPLLEGAVRVPGLIRELGAARVGVTAFRVDAPEQVDAVREELRAEVQRQTGAGVDALLVMAQAPRDLTRRLVAGIPGIDVVIQGRAPGETPAAPELLDSGAIWVASGQQAQHAGVLELVLDARDPSRPLPVDDRKGQSERRTKVLELRVKELVGQVAQAPEGPRRDFLAGRVDAARAELEALRRTDVSTPLAGPHVRARAVPLPRGAAEEAQAKAALEAYTSQIPTLVASCEATLTCPDPAPGQPSFVGAVACKACHAAAYDFWKAQAVQLPGKDKAGTAVVRTVGHAHAWETLTADGKDKDRTCVGCHSVGFGVTGGACRTSDIVPRGLSAVQCESCHGPGSAHVKAPQGPHIVRKPDEVSCRGCHHVPHIPTTESFVFDERLKLILGPGHGEQRRATLP